MPTAEELQQQQQVLAQRRQQLEQQKREVESYKTVPNFSQEQLRASSRDRGSRPNNALMERERRKSEILGREKQKEQAMSQIQSLLGQQEQMESEYQQALSQYEQQQQAQREAEEYQLALDVYSGRVASNSQIRNILRNIPKEVKEEAQKKAESLERQQARLGISEYKEQVESLVPINVKVDLAQAKIDPSQFNVLNIKELGKLKQAGLIDFQETQAPIIPTAEEEALQMSLLSPKNLNQPLQMSLLPPEKNLFQKGIQKAGNVLYGGAELATKGLGYVADVPVGKLLPGVKNQPSLVKAFIPSKVQAGFDKATVGEVSSEFSRGVSGLGERVGKGYENLFSTLNIPLDREQKPKVDIVKEKFGISTLPPTVDEKGYFATRTGAGVIVDISKQAPTLGLAGTGAGFGFLVATETLSGAQDYKNREKLYQQSVDTIYSKARETPLAEGYSYLTKEEIEQQYGSEIKENIKKGIVTNVGVSLGTGLLLGVLSGGKYLFEKRVIGREGAITGQKQAQIISSDVRAAEGRILTDEGIASYQIPKLIQVREPVIERTTTKFREIFKLGELPIKIVSPAKVFVDTPLFPLLDDTGTIFIRQAIGKGGKLGKPQGLLLTGDKEIKLTMEELSKLKIPEFMGKRLSKSIVQDYGFVGDIIPIPEKAKVGLSKISTMEFSKLKEPKVRVDVDTKKGIINIIAPELGKRNIYQVVASRVSLGEVKGVKIFGLDQISKDISSGAARRIGKTPITKGLVFKFPDINLPDVKLKDINPFYRPTAEEGSSITILRPSGGKKTPLSKTFPDTQLESSKAVSVPETIKPVNIRQSPLTGVARADESTLSIKTLPAVTQESRVTQDPFYGTGQYERTEGGQELKQEGITLLKLDIKTVQQEDLRLKTQSILKLAQDVKINQQQPNIIEGLLKIKTAQKIDLRQPTLEKLRQEQRTSQRLRTPQISISTSETPTKRPTKTPTRIKLFPKSSKERLIDIAEEIKGDFKVFVRKKGKDVKIGEFGTLPGARTKLQKELKGTLRASGFVETKGRRLKFEEVGLGNEFEPSKIDFGRIVQKKSRRLGTRPETKEIQYFKKRKGGKGFF